MGAAATWGACGLAGLHGLTVHGELEGRGVPKGNVANPAVSAGARARRGTEVLGEKAHLTQWEGSSGHILFHGAGTTNRQKKESSEWPRLLTLTAGRVVFNYAHFPRAVCI